MAKISWSKALADYLRDETESYASVARKHGVSLQAVKKRAGKEGWQNLRQKSIQKVNQELPKLIGESVADVNARHAQIGRVFQAVALKAIKEKNLEPENFMQAVRSVVEGTKIERETFGMKESKKVGEVVGRGWGIFNNPEMAKKYSINRYKPLGVFNNPAMAKEASIKTPITQSPKPLLAAAPVNRPPEQTPFNKPMVDPQLLAKVQEGLSRISERLDEVKRKLETRKTESASANDRLTGWS